MNGERVRVGGDPGKQRSRRRSIVIRIAASLLLLSAVASVVLNMGGYYALVCEAVVLQLVVIHWMRGGDLTVSIREHRPGDREH